jgi:hypothetical protein
MHYVACTLLIALAVQCVIVFGTASGSVPIRELAASGLPAVTVYAGRSLLASHLLMEP